MDVASSPDVTAFVPESIRKLRNHQTDLPRIAKDPRLMR